MLVRIGVFVNNFNFNASMFVGVKIRVESDDSQVCSLRFDLFPEGSYFRLALVYLCLQLRF